MTSNPYGDPLVFLERFGRIAQRAVRANELLQWGLNPQNADAGSCMATDDEGLMSDFGERRFESAALWPLMSATDSVSSAANIFLQGTQTRQLHAPAMAALCRSAIESSGRVIWLLSPEDRQIRRDRCTAIALAEMKEQTNHNGDEVAALRTGEVKAPPEERKEFTAGSKDLRARYDQLNQNYAKNPDREKVRPFGTTAELAAEWIQCHVPAHDSGEISKNGMAFGVKRIYGITSAVMHGYKWANDYLNNGDLFAMLADSFAAAVNLTECGIALFEAQAQDHRDTTSRTRHYPARLLPTVVQWSSLYPAAS